MQIACPACAASYQVPDAMIGDGRQMRCVRCGEDWFAKPLAPAVTSAPTALPSSEQALPPAPAPVASSPAPPPLAARSRRGLALPLAWLASLAAWAGGLYALWIMREPLTEFWPPIARLYALLGPA